MIADIKVKSFRKPIVKVDSSTNPSLTPANGGVQRGQQGASAPADNAAAASRTPAPSGDADVNLSSLSSNLRGLAASGSGDIDVAHVESIKAAIRDGSLAIDTGKIADGVLQTARELLQRNPSTGG
ncbi:flagellar biosynthesis anti-sigma factor FlgM [Paraburkholderia jirisanensis]